MKDFTSIKIRKMTNSQEDTLFVIGLRNKPDIKDKFYSDEDLTVEGHLKHFAKSEARGDLLYIVERNGKLVGMCALDHVDEKNKRIEWGRLLVIPEEYGTGLGSYIEYNMMDYAFNGLGMEKIYCEVLDDNLGVVKLHKGFGFKEEGFFRNHIIKKGVRRSFYVLGMLKEEWDQKRFKKIFGERII